MPNTNNKDLRDTSLAASNNKMTHKNLRTSNEDGASGLVNNMHPGQTIKSMEVHSSSDTNSREKEVTTDHDVQNLGNEGDSASDRTKAVLSTVLH